MTSQLLDDARQWVIDVHPSQSEHLLQTEYWLQRIAPSSSLIVQMAALTHDMERAFPGDDAPDMRAMKSVHDTNYILAHGHRSAKFVSAWLREQGSEEQFIWEVSQLIIVHEYGGWPEADLVQAADSLSFLEVNTEKFLAWVPTAQNGWTLEKTVTKFEWMYGRITPHGAKILAEPLFNNAMNKLRAAAS